MFRLKRWLAVLLLVAVAQAAPVTVVTEAGASARELYGAERLREALAGVTAPGATVVVGMLSSKEVAKFGLPEFWPQAKEAFLIRQIGQTWVVTGSDASGVLYGELELAARVKATGKLPEGIDDTEHPALKLRGTAIGMQKPELTYDNAEYDYPYTPKDFPFFYDKAAWTKYLDMLADERMNTLYLWNGHPFTSLLKLPRYPEAQELPMAQLDANIAMFKWLTAEADKRGIWVLQGFYNIHLSHNFARAHKMAFHLSTPNPEASAYTRYAVSEFVREYPNAGLMMTLGEALSPHKGVEWLTETIIPGVKDGLRELGTTVEPPIVVRAHATDIADVMKAAIPLYSNIDTMFKWNGESLTSTNVRGPVLDEFKMLAEESNVTVANIHLLSNLEPFRWGDPDFVRQVVTNFQRIGIGGVHVYPLRYWEWPFAGDATQPLLNQTDRDWIWYASWGRYAWNPNREPEAEHTYWAGQFAEKYGSAAAGEKLLEAYTLAGPAQPRLLPWIGITEGNRQAFTLGMTMPQLIDPDRFNPAQTLWTGDAPAGERLAEYVTNLIAGLPQPKGENPIDVADQVSRAADRALEVAQSAFPDVTKNKEEYLRVVNDLKAIALLMRFYNYKTLAAKRMLEYGYSHNPEYLKGAEGYLAFSVEEFRQLTAVAGPAYRTATSMETSQRQIPFRGGSDQFPNWQQCLPMYEKELVTFRARVAQLSAGKTSSDAIVSKLPEVGFTLKPGAGEVFTVARGQGLFMGAGAAISSVAPEIDGMKGIRISPSEGGTLRFDLAKPAQVLVGFVKSTSKKQSVLDPETEQWNLLLLNAVSAAKTPTMAVWAKPLPAGANELDLGKGTYVVLGFIPEATKVAPHVNFVAGQAVNLDWFFE